MVLLQLVVLPQTPSVVERNIGNRNVSAESRAKRAKLDDDQRNLIKCWDDLKTYCQGLSLVCDLRTELINLYCIEGKPPSIIYSITISIDMKICAFKGNSEVSIRDVVPSFDWKLRRYSELDDIMKKVRTYPMNMQTEIKHAADTLRSQCDNSDLTEVHIKKECIFFANNWHSAAYRAMPDDVITLKLCKWPSNLCFVVEIATKPCEIF